MDIRTPPLFNAGGGQEEIGIWADEFSDWMLAFYEWLKFPHFHRLGLVGPVTYTSSQTLTNDDLCRIVKADSTSQIVFELPEATTAILDYWVCVERSNTGILRIEANGTDTIGPSNSGGFIKSEETRDKPRISLVVSEAGAWTFGLSGSYGIWKVY